MTGAEAPVIFLLLLVIQYSNYCDFFAVVENDSLLRFDDTLAYRVTDEFRT